MRREPHSCILPSCKERPENRVMPFRMSSLAVLLLLTCACLPGCREKVPDEEIRAEETEAPGPAAGEMPRMARDTSGKLKWQDRPLAEGARVPTFEGLPADGPAIVVFYRGHW